MILFDEIVEVFVLSHLSRFQHLIFALEFLDRRWIRGVLVHVDHPWRLGMMGLQNLFEKRLAALASRLALNMKSNV